MAPYATFLVALLACASTIVSASSLGHMQIHSMHNGAGGETAPFHITGLHKNGSATAGSGAVSAAGTLVPFGTDVGLGCGINWQQKASIGGGFQAGSDVFGVGSGVTIGPATVDVGLGLNLIPEELKTSVSMSASKNGSVSLVFAASGEVTCKETKVANMKSAMRCTVGRAPHSQS